MSFARPEWLAAGALAVLLLLLLLRRAGRIRAADLSRFASSRLLGELTASLSPARRRLRRALALAALALGAVALAEPQAGFTWQETQRRGIDVMLALDVSRSMLAQDIVPDRLRRAKLAVADLVEKLGSDRVGLIAFAGTAFLQCPLTLDHAAFLESLEALGPGIIPAPGSDLAAALRAAAQALRSEKRNVKLLVLLSDGEDLAGEAAGAAKELAAQGIRVFTIGVGSPAGELVPVPSEGGGTELLKDSSGKLVKSRLDEATLHQVAEVTGGFYEPLGQRGEGVDAVYRRALEPIPKEELASRMRRVPRNRYRWPLAAAVLLLAVEPLVGERVRPWPDWLRRRARWLRRGGPASPRKRSTSGAVAGATILALACGASARPAAASPRSAQALYEAGEFERALEQYRDAARSNQDEPRLEFNLGAAAYKAGKLDEAAAAFARALRSPAPELQESSFYNLGNTQFRLGERSRESDAQATAQAWRQALEAYDEALRLDPADVDARHNRDVVATALEQLEREQQQGGQRQEQAQQQGQQAQEEQSQGAQQRDPSQEPGEGGPSGEEEQQDEKGGDAGTPREQDRQPGQQGQSEAGGEPGDRDAGREAQPERAARGAEPREPSAQPEGDRAPADQGPQPQPGSEPSGKGQRQEQQPPQASTAGQGSPPPGGPSETANDAAAGTARAGQMSASEARELLESLRGEERRVPILPGAGRRLDDPGAPVRDW